MCNESLTLEQMRADMLELFRLQAEMNALIAKMKTDTAKCWGSDEPNDGGARVLIASAACPCCSGRGEVRESHGEWLPCYCVFEAAAIESGESYVVEPNPAWVAKMKTEKCCICGEPNDGDDTGRCGLCRQGVAE